MRIRDLGEEAIGGILAEAADGMRRRTGKLWELELDGVTGDLRMMRDRKYAATANVQPDIPPQHERGKQLPEAIRFHTALRRRVLEATQAVTPVPGASDVPAALQSTFRAIEAIDDLERTRMSHSPFLAGLRHDLHRILDHLTGNDHSGCSSKPSVADYGRVVDLGPGDTQPLPKGFLVREVTTTTHPDGSQTVRTRQD